MNNVAPDDLRKLAEAAAPGSWTADNTLGGATVFGPDGDSVAVARGNPAIEADRVITAEQNAAYIAAANPQAVLSLLDERDRLQAKLEECNQAFKRMRGQRAKARVALRALTEAIAEHEAAGTPLDQPLADACSALGGDDA